MEIELETIEARARGSEKRSPAKLAMYVWIMAKEIRRLRANPPAVPDGSTCTWTEDSDGNWETSCDNMHTIIEGTPFTNSMDWCCYCGKELMSVKLRVPTDGDHVPGEGAK